MADRVFQFKITIKEITPIIWRRIVVPESYSFWDLHVAIQDALGWLDYHLHVFKMRRKHSSEATEIGIPNEDRFEDEPEILAGWDIPIADYFYDVGVTADYDYDFGDDWQHEIVLEGILLEGKGSEISSVPGRRKRLSSRRLWWSPWILSAFRGAFRSK